MRRAAANSGGNAHQTFSFDPTIHTGGQQAVAATRRRPGVHFAMKRNREARGFTRSTPELIEEAIAILRQDASEYAFIGLVGAFAACMAVLVPGIIAARSRLH